MFQNLVELPVFPYTIYKERLQVTDKRLGTVDAMQSSLMIAPDAITSIQEYECVFTEILKNNKKKPTEEVKVAVKFCCINTLTSSVYTALDKESLLKLIKESEQRRWFENGTMFNSSSVNDTEKMIESIKKAEDIINKRITKVTKDLEEKIIKLELNSTSEASTITADELFN